MADAWGEIVSSFRSHKLAIPTRAALPLTSITELIDIENVLRTECEDALEELARDVEFNDNE